MTEVYKIGVKLAMTSNAPAVVAALGKQLLGLNVKVKDLTGSLNKLHYAVGGAFAMWAGDKILGGIVSIIDRTKDLSHELTQLQKMGAPADMVGRANGVALDTIRSIQGVTQTDALKAWGALYAVSRSEKDASEATALLSAYSQVIGNTTGSYGTSTNDLLKVLRAADMLGRMTDPKTKQFDLKRLQGFLDVAEKLQVGTEGMVNAQTLLGLGQQGGPSLRGMSDRGLMAMGILGQYMGGPRAGTSYMSLMQQMAGGTMWPRNAQALQELGLLHPGEWKAGRGGGITLNNEASKRLMGMIKDDPMSFVNDGLLKAMHKKGINGIDDEIREVFRTLPRQTTQRMVADFIMNYAQFQRELEGMMKAPGIWQSKGLQDDKDVTQGLQNVQAAWQNLWYAVAGPNSEYEIALLKTLTNGINRFSGIIRGTNPEKIMMIAKGIAVLGAALIGGGVVAILAALGPVGWVAAGIIALGAAVAAWGPKVLLFLGPGGWIIYGLIKLGTALAGHDWSGAFKKLISGLQSLWDKLKGMFSGDAGIPNVPSPMNYMGGGQFIPIALRPSYRSPLGGPASRPDTILYDPAVKKEGDKTRPVINASFVSPLFLKSLPLAGKKNDESLGLHRNVAYSGNGFSEALASHVPRQTDDGVMSSAIPPRHHSEIHFHNVTRLDGRVIAENTIKHIVRRGNMVASGGRMTDVSLTRPINI